MTDCRSGSDNRPIGVFDSGIGGLTVLREIWKTLPGESTVYFGDSGRAPYGTKSHDTIVEYSLQDMRFLLRQNVKMIVIACNTASAHAFRAVSENSPVPVVEVITSGAADAVRITREGRIGIIGTRATVGSGIYRTAVEDAAREFVAENPEDARLSSLYIEQAACPLFVSLAEEGWWDTEIARLTAKTYLQSLKDNRVDTLILGCTHYPLLAPAISRVMGEEVRLVNAGRSVAEKVRRVMNERGIAASDDASVTHAFFTSDDPVAFEEVTAPFLGGARPHGTRRVSPELDPD